MYLSTNYIKNTKLERMEGAIKNFKVIDVTRKREK